MRKTPQARTPSDNNPLRLRNPKKKAAGIPAILSSAVHGLSKMGAVKTVKTLSMVNQQAGFDCPGCAWPDPAHRTTFEFCENGAKAVADEAMKATVTPSFFARYSVTELAEMSDYELNRKGRIAHPMVLEAGAEHYLPISWEDAFKRIQQALLSSGDDERAVF